MHLTHGHRIHVRVLAALCIAAGAVSSSHAQGVPDRAATISDIWQGVFTEAQADSGAAVFEAHCAVCHDTGQLGEAPALTTDTFLRSWEGHTAGRLYSKILETMPPADVESVTAERKLDVLVFILRENGFPTGARELTTDRDALERIRIVPKGGPAPLRSGAMVQVVGCLASAPNRGWLLANGTEPEATVLDRAGDGASDASRTRPLGTHTIRLLAVFPRPDALIGHRVEAKGLLVRSGNDIVVNVVTLRSAAPVCR
jgi:hypothetical protein